MSERKKNNPLAGILFGPALGFFAVTALWHNEGRFDYYKAAKATTPIGIDGSYEAGETISLTGAMDQALTLEGDYVDSFTGYLTVRRSAEIYAWEENKDSDGDVTYRLDWNSSVESISRNDGVEQLLRSNTFTPAEYWVGDWLVESDRLDFVDPRQSISPGDLALSADGDELELRSEDSYFYLRKGEPKNLGDERVGYSGIPVPELATYFGAMQDERGVAHVAEVKTSWVSGLIQDTGLLHHLAAGDRETALAAVKADLARLKWIVRAIGTVAVILAYLILFSGLFSLLLHIPLINRVAELGILVVSLILGVVTSGLTIVSSYLIHHPVVLLGILGSIVGLVIYVRRRRQQTRVVAREGLTRTLGHEPSERELAERQLVFMAGIAVADGQLDSREEKLLQTWAEDRGLSGDDVARLLTTAKSETADTGVRTQEDLTLLIQLALADEDLSQLELKKLYQAGQQLGYSKGKVRHLVTRAQAA
ncbi:MAG: TMEM43 family protein [Acidobacteriota bacterium]